MPSPVALQPLPRIEPGDVLLGYEGLTFPPLERRLALRPRGGPLLGAAVHAARGPVGLCLAELTAEGPSQVVSLLVRPGYRGRRLGALLLAETERLLAEGGAGAVEGAYRTSWRSRAAIERLLATAGWSPPETRLLVGRGETRRTAAIPARLAAGLVLPPEAELFGWGELDPAERESLLAEHGEGIAFPEVLSPFQEESRLDSRISVGLRWQGEVAGWLIVHRVGADTVQYTTLWVRPDLRRRGLARALDFEVLRRRLADPSVRYGIFAITPDNTAMRRFVEEFSAPHLTTWAELRVSGKLLTG